VQEASIYIMDEPFQGVDARTERAIVEVLRELKRRGDTVVAVHHALQTVPEYFDDVAILNVRKIASGPVPAVFTEENLRLAYGGRLPFLHRLAEDEGSRPDGGGAGPDGEGQGPDGEGARPGPPAGDTLAEESARR
jgi:manganese/zinc/iron transport system ATP- binding protein